MAKTNVLWTEILKRWQMSCPEMEDEVEREMTVNQDIEEWDVSKSVVVEELERLIVQEQEVKSTCRYPPRMTSRTQCLGRKENLASLAREDKQRRQ